MVTLSEQQIDYHGRIIRQACNDILRESPIHSRPRFNLREHVVEEIKRLSDENIPRYLFYRHRYEVFQQQRVSDDFPPCFQIEPTSVCNYRCVFCRKMNKDFAMKSNGHMGMMSLDLFRKVVDEAVGQCEVIHLAL